MIDPQSDLDPAPPKPSEAQSRVIDTIIKRVSRPTGGRCLVCQVDDVGRHLTLAWTAQRITEELGERVLVLAADDAGVARIAEALRSVGLGWVIEAGDLHEFSEAIARGMKRVVSTLDTANRCDPVHFPDPGWFVLADGVEKGFGGKRAWKLRETLPVAPWIGFAASLPKSVKAEVRFIFSSPRDPDGALVVDPPT